MSFENLLESSERLIQFMRDDGYSIAYITGLRVEIRWLERNGDAYSSYEDACLARQEATVSVNQKKHYRTMYRILKRFDLEGSLPDGRRVDPLFPRGAYHELCPAFRKVVDSYSVYAAGRGLDGGGTWTHVRNCSCFLRHMQGRGRSSLAEVTEDDVLSFFTDASGGPSRSYGYLRQVARVLGTFDDGAGEAERVLLLLPPVRTGQKNVDYLRPEELDCVRAVLDGTAGSLCLLDRAFGTLLLHTGMRSCDAVGLTFPMIDWEREEMHLVQAKTGVPLSLPLPAAVGNALFDYVTHERPGSPDEHVFLGRSRPHGPLAPGSSYGIVARIFDAAGIRTGGGERRGAHLFRHNAATAMVSSGVPVPVVSAVLGHEDPGSLEHYLHADIAHLRGCALSIERFPVQEGVFDA